MIELLAGLTLGLHLGTIHLNTPQHLNGINPGAYLRTEHSLQVGAYVNSVRRPTLYLAQSLEVVRGVDLVVGLATGYRRREQNVPCKYTDLRPCQQWDTSVKGTLSPLLAISTARPLDGDLNLRVSVTPIPPCPAPDYTARASSSSWGIGVHFSIEKAF
jgi:hypothetical protein